MTDTSYVPFLGESAYVPFLGEAAYVPYEPAGFRGPPRQQTYVKTAGQMAAVAGSLLTMGIGMSRWQSSELEKRSKAATNANPDTRKAQQIGSRATGPELA
jgi:hypothetical protein